MAIPGISKSRFTDYIQCPKLGYMSCYRGRFKHLADPLEWMALHLIGEGNRAGELARECFPGGSLIGHIYDLDRALAETAAAMAAETATHVFEGAFACDGLLCRVDILRKRGAGKVDLIEVKASNGVKPEHIADVGFQLAVLEGAGLQVRSACLMHFNPDYVYPGPAERTCAGASGGYDVESLFIVDDVTDEARRWQSDNLPALLDSMRSDLARLEPPWVPLRNTCSDCVYYRQVCSVGAPLHPAWELASGWPGLLEALHEAGIEDVREVPDDFPRLGEKQRLVLEAARTGALVVDREKIRGRSGGLVHPLWFVDFETFMPGLPIFPGMRPWQPIPFQWSLHVLEKDGSLRHEGFLRADGSDPRRAFAEALLGAMGETGSVLVYNKSMESTRLRELARDFPDLSGALLAIDARIVDLLPIVRESCYHLDFHGSRSLKVVTSVLVPHLSYGDLGVKAGTEAMEAYERITASDTPEDERERLRAELLDYCGLDTLAMVEVLKRLLAGGERCGVGVRDA
jgi:hypothetical protein